MTDRLGVFREPDAELILKVVRYLVDNGFVVGHGRTTTRPMPTIPIIPVRNDSGVAVPAWACMQITGTVEYGNQNYITIDQPTDNSGEAGGFLFNSQSEIAIGGYGIAHDGPVVRMLTDGSSVVAGDRWRPIVNAWTVEPGGSQFSAIGDDDIGTDVMRAFVTDPTTNPSIIHFKSQGGGIPALSGSTMGNATCDLYDSSSGGVLSDSGTDITIYNTAAAFAATTFGIAAKNEAGLWVAIVEKC